MSRLTPALIQQFAGPLFNRLLTRKDREKDEKRQDQLFDLKLQEHSRRQSQLGLQERELTEWRVPSVQNSQEANRLREQEGALKQADYARKPIEAQAKAFKDPQAQAEYRAAVAQAQARREQLEGPPDPYSLEVEVLSGVPGIQSRSSERELAEKKKTGEALESIRTYGFGERQKKKAEFRPTTAYEREALRRKVRDLKIHFERARAAVARAKTNMLPSEYAQEEANRLAGELMVAEKALQESLQSEGSLQTKTSTSAEDDAINAWKAGRR